MKEVLFDNAVYIGYLSLVTVMNWNKFKKDSINVYEIMNDQISKDIRDIVANRCN